MHDLNCESNKVGLKMNKTKTKVMANRPTTIKVEDDLLENVTGYTYLGNLVTNEGNHEKEISRRLGIAWSNFDKYFQSPTFSLSLKGVMTRSMVDALSELCSPFVKGGNSEFIAAIASGLFPETEYRSLE